jgi:hypothetical protein
MKALQFVASLAIASVSLIPFTGLQAAETTPVNSSLPAVPAASPTADQQVGLLFDASNRPDPGDPNNAAAAPNPKLLPNFTPKPVNQLPDCA